MLFDIIAQLGEPSRRITGAGPAKAIVMLSLILVMYFIPTVFAFSRRRRNKWKIAAVNLFLGWTFIGWFVAMLMSYAYEGPRDGTANGDDQAGSVPQD
jgi:hypothetical protein